MNGYLSEVPLAAQPVAYGCTNLAPPATDFSHPTNLVYALPARRTEDQGTAAQ